jgi:hypothetical protein
LPPEIKKELKETSDSTEEELKKFDHLKKPFIDALKKAGKKNGKEGKPDK